MANNSQNMIFISDDGIQHTLWVMDDPEDIKTIQNAFVAHRICMWQMDITELPARQKVGLKSASSFPITQRRRIQLLWRLSFHNQLKIYDYNRVVKDLNGLTKDEFLAKVAEKWNVTPIPEGEKFFVPQKKHNISMYLEGKWYRLELQAGNSEREKHCGRPGCFHFTE